ncbi:MAG: cytosine deaminase [Alphaproteobacteria bacterium]|nr:cytosine deaminase [Alphaproteobacteria bacterium]
MQPFLAIPPGDSLRLVDASVPASLIDGPCPARIDGDGVARVDIEIRAGKVAAIAPARQAPGVDLRGAMVFPTFADLHTHLDKGHIWPRAQNPDGSFAGAIGAVRADRGANWHREDILRRFEFGLKCSYVHGTSAIRTHLDSYPGQAERAWSVFVELRDAWKDRIALQAVSITTLDLFDGEHGVELANLVARSGGVLGAVTRVSGGIHDDVPPEFLGQIDRLFGLAEERGLDLDLHVDESGETGARALGLIARIAIRRGFKRKLTCGHCCSLAVQPDEVIAETIGLCADAGIAVVSLPMCNLFLQDRVPGRTPRWRGVTLLHELAAAGIPVSVASDNCRDPFYGYGDHDMLEVFREATRIGHLDRPFADWPRAVAATPAAVMGVGAGLIAAGRPADLVVFRARRFSELLSRHQADRVVLRAGRAVTESLPSYEELDPVVLAASEAAA